MSTEQTQSTEKDVPRSLNLPRPERVPADCCSDHNVMCWYDACCGACPERERCRARLGPGPDAPRCTLPVSEHSDPRSTDPAEHEWDPGSSDKARMAAKLCNHLHGKDHATLFCTSAWQTIEIITSKEN